jgi:hypothetical protein
MSHRAALLLAVTVTIAPALAAWASTGQRVKDAPDVPSTGIETFRSGKNVVQIDRTGKGAVLCAWGIYESIRVIGRECHQGQDVAFRTELDQSLARIDDFIMKNSRQSPITKADLNARRMEGLKQLHASGNICMGDGEKMYVMFRTRGAPALRAQTTDLLSVPREPVMNPCL